MIALLDVNVLVALFDPMHSNHEAAHEWFAENRAAGWATCPLTGSREPKRPIWLSWET